MGDWKKWLSYIGCAALLLILFAFAAYFAGFHRGETGAGLTGILSCTTATLSPAEQAQLNKNLSVYQEAARKANIPWEFIAALHYRETHLRTDDPDPFQIQNRINSGFNVTSAVEAAEKAKSLLKGSYNRTLSTSSDEETIKLGFLAYNRGSMYKTGGCNVDQSPYVMNFFDAAHQNMRWPNNSCEPDSTRGKIDTNLGTFTVYSALKGCLVAEGDCGNALFSAEKYLNRGIGYSQDSHCGPDSKGPEGVTKVDCSGYTSRAYHDANYLPNSYSKWCLSTVGIANAIDRYNQVASNNVTAAKNIVQSGDIILFGLKGQRGSAVKINDNAHAVLYGGKNGTKDIVYESGRNGGPNRSEYNVWGGGRILYGVFRSKLCAKGPTESAAPITNGNTVTIDPGHPSDNIISGINTGTRNDATGITENQVNWEVALKVKRILEQKGIRVVMTKSSVDQYVTNQHRAEIANNSGSAFFFRIHADSTGDPNFFIEYPDKIGEYKGVRGPPAEVLGPSKEAASIISRNVKQSTGKNGSIKTERSVSTSVTNLTGGVLIGSLYSGVPTATIEMIGMGASKENALWIANSANQEKMAQGIANGIVEFLNQR